MGFIAAPLGAAAANGAPPIDVAVALQSGGEPAQPAAPAAQAGAKWTVAQLLDRALRNNPLVQSAEQGSRAASAELSAAKWQYFPTPQVAVEGDRHDHVIVSSVSQPLYAFGRLKAGLDVARAGQHVADYRAADVQRSIALRVVDAFGQFANATRLMEVWNSDIERHTALRELISRRIAAGVSAPVDLNLVRTRTNQARIALETLGAKRRSALVTLSQLVGVQLTGDQVEVFAADHVPQGGYFLDGIGPEGIVDRSLANNPGLMRADAEIATAQAEQRQARAAMLPTVVARFENRTYSSGYPSTGLPDTRLTIGVQLATGAGLSSVAGIRASQAKAHAAEYARDAARNDLVSTVIADREAFLAARATVQGLRQSRDEQEQTAESYNRMFLAGKRSWLDVLNMVREQTNIERDLADANVQLIVSDLRLRIDAGEIR